MKQGVSRFLAGVDCFKLVERYAQLQKPNRCRAEAHWAAIVAAAVVSCVLLALGSSFDISSDAFTIPVDVIDNATIARLIQQGNYTAQCGTNANSQIFCTAVSFSIIAGGFGLFNVCRLLWLIVGKTPDRSIKTVCMFEAAACALCLSLWSYIVDVNGGGDSLYNANLAFGVLAAAAWTTVWIMQMLSPIVIQKDEIEAS